MKGLKSVTDRLTDLQSCFEKKLLIELEELSSKKSLDFFFLFQNHSVPPTARGVGGSLHLI